MKLRINRVGTLVNAAIFIGTAMLGCKGFVEPASAQLAGNKLSPPPTMNAALKARHIRTCAEVTHVPSAAEAGALIQCGQEKEDRDGDYLFQNLQIRMSAPRAYIYNQDSHLTNIDTTLKLYPIRVTGDWYGCHGRATCTVQHITNGEGSCWKTTFGNWQCYTSAGYEPRDPNETQKPGPTTY
jgi:hypothetical protein